MQKKTKMKHRDKQMKMALSERFWNKCWNSVDHFQSAYKREKARERERGERKREKESARPTIAMVD